MRKRSLLSRCPTYLGQKLICLFNILGFTGYHSVYCGLSCDSMGLSVWLQRFSKMCCFLFRVPDPEDVAFHLPYYLVPHSSYHKLRLYFSVSFQLLAIISEQDTQTETMRNCGFSLSSGMLRLTISEILTLMQKQIAPPCNK
jgi:hypothetical protein